MWQVYLYLPCQYFNQYNILAWPVRIKNLFKSWAVRVLIEFRKGTSGLSHSYTGQGTANGLGPHGYHYSLVIPNTRALQTLVGKLQMPKQSGLNSLVLHILVI